MRKRSSSGELFEPCILPFALHVLHRMFLQSILVPQKVAVCPGRRFSAFTAGHPILGCFVFLVFFYIVFLLLVSACIHDASLGLNRASRFGCALAHVDLYLCICVHEESVHMGAWNYPPMVCNRDLATVSLMYCRSRCSILVTLVHIMMASML